MPPQTRHTETSILESYLLTPSPLPTIIPYSEFLKLVPTQHRSHPDIKRFYRDLQFQRNIDIDTVRQNIEREVARGTTLKSQLARRIADEHGHGGSSSRKGTEKRDQGRKRKRVSKGRGGHEDDDDDDDGGNESVNDSITNNDDDPLNRNEISIDTTYHHSTLHPAHTDPQLQASRNHPLTAATREYHTTETLTASLDSTCTALETEIADLETESARLLAEMNEIVGSMSDLRYGRFARPVSFGGDDTGGTGGDGETVEDEIVDLLKGLERRVLQGSTR